MTSKAEASIVAQTVHILKVSTVVVGGYHIGLHSSPVDVSHPDSSEDDGGLLFFFFLGKCWELMLELPQDRARELW